MSDTRTIQDIALQVSKGLSIGPNLLQKKGKVLLLNNRNIQFIFENKIDDLLYVGARETNQLDRNDYVYNGDLLFGIDEFGKTFIIEVNFEIDHKYIASDEFVIVAPNSFLKNYLRITRHKNKIITDLGAIKNIDELKNKIEQYPIDLNASMSSELELDMEEVDEKPIENDVDEFKEELNLSAISMTQKTEALSNILKRIEHNEINMNTKFQRSASLWEEDKKCKLIESILLNFPIPAFYFDASDDGNWLIIDGLQRLSSIKEFVLDNSLVLEDLDFLKNLEGKKYKDLDRPFQRKIEEFEIVVYKVLPGTPNKIKSNLFKRINSGALKLEDQEIRHALNQGLPAETLIKFSRFKEFKEIVQFSDKRVNRMEDREIVLRYLAFRLTPYTQYTGNIKTFLDNAMEKLNTVSEDQLTILERDFKHGLITCQKLFGIDTFRRSIIDKEERARRFSKVIYEPWIHSVSKLTVEERNNLVKNQPRVVQIFKAILRGEKNELGHDVEHEFDAFANNQAYTSKRLKERFESIELIVKKWAK